VVDLAWFRSRTGHRSAASARLAPGLAARKGRFHDVILLPADLRRLDEEMLA
jgi:hypothetical protein